MEQGSGTGRQGVIDPFLYGGDERPGAQGYEGMKGRIGMIDLDRQQGVKVYRKE